MTAAKTMSDEEVLAYARANYGYLAAFLKMPEVGPILLKAAKNGYDSNRLLGLLAKTKWWKTTTASARTFDAEAKLDPATNARKIANAQASIASLASRDGLHLSGAMLKQIARDSLRLGWSDDQVKAALGHQYHYNPTQTQTGQAALTVNKLKSIAAEYLVPISDSTVNKWTQDVLSGKIDEDSFIGYAKQQAKSRWPGLADAIERGITPGQYTNTYRETIAQQLEVDPDSINLMQPRWSKVIDQTDPKTGARTAMTLSDAATYARQQPEYAHTAQARQQSAQLTSFLAKTFGEVAS